MAKGKRAVSMPSDHYVETKYRTTCSICKRKAKWAFTKQGKRYGACSRKHLRRIK